MTTVVLCFMAFIVLLFLAQGGTLRRRMFSDMASRQLKLPEVVYEQNTVGALLLPFMARDAVISQVDEDHHIHFDDQETGVHLHVVIKEATEYDRMVKGAKSAPHYFIAEYEIMFPRALPRGVRWFTPRDDERLALFTEEREALTQMVWEFSEAESGEFALPFPDGLLLCDTEPEVLTLWATQQFDEVSVLARCDGQGDTFRCVYMGDFKRLPRNEHIRELMERQIEQVLTFARICQPWDGVEEQMSARVARLWNASPAQYDASQRSVAAQVALMAHQRAGFDTMTHGLRGQILKPSLHWDYARLAPWIPGDWIEACEESALVEMAIASLDVRVWRELEARRGAGDVLVDMALPVEHRAARLVAYLDDERLPKWLRQSGDVVLLEACLEQHATHELWLTEEMLRAVRAIGVTLSYEEHLHLFDVLVQLAQREHDTPGEGAIWRAYAWLLRGSTELPLVWVLGVMEHDREIREERELWQVAVDESAIQELRDLVFSGGLYSMMGLMLLYAVLQSEVHRDDVLFDETLRFEAVKTFMPMFEVERVDEDIRPWRDQVAERLLANAPGLFNEKFEQRLLQGCIEAYLGQVEREGPTKSSTKALSAIEQGASPLLARRLRRTLEQWAGGLDSEGHAAGALTHVDDHDAGQLSAIDER